MHRRPTERTGGHESRISGFTSDSCKSVTCRAAASLTCVRPFAVCSSRLSSAFSVKSGKGTSSRAIRSYPLPVSAIHLVGPLYLPVVVGTAGGV